MFIDGVLHLLQSRKSFKSMFTQISNVGSFFFKSIKHMIIQAFVDKAKAMVVVFDG